MNKVDLCFLLEKRVELEAEKGLWIPTQREVSSYTLNTQNIEER